jgi:hypothetical protein
MKVAAAALILGLLLSGAAFAAGKKQLSDMLSNGYQILAVINAPERGPGVREIYLKGQWDMLICYIDTSKALDGGGGIKLLSCSHT